MRQGATEKGKRKEGGNGGALKIAVTLEAALEGLGAAPRLLIQHIVQALLRESGI